MYVFYLPEIISNAIYYQGDVSSTPRVRVVVGVQSPVEGMTKATTFYSQRKMRGVVDSRRVVVDSRSDPHMWRQKW